MTPAEVLREAQGAGLAVSIASSGNLYVAPAARLAPELRALLLAHKSELLGHLRRAEAANDLGDGVAAWIERRRVAGLEGASPATVARLHAASVALDKKIAAVHGDTAES